MRITLPQISLSLFPWIFRIFKDFILEVNNAHLLVGIVFLCLCGGHQVVYIFFSEVAKLSKGKYYEVT